MKRSRRLQPAVEMAKRKETEAAQALEAARAMLAQEQQRLDDLSAYYSEYDQLFKAQTRGLRAQDMVTKRDFMTQLAQSCKAQQGQIERVKHHYENAKRQWHQCYLKHENLCAFVKKIAQEELALADKREQGLIDEWVTQNHSRR